MRLICDGIKDRNLIESKAEYKKILADLVLRKRIELALCNQSQLDHDLLDIAVRDGQVTLSGQLHSEADRKQTVALTEGTTGVRTVVDQIRIISYRLTHRSH